MKCRANIYTPACMADFAMAFPIAANFAQVIARRRRRDDVLFSVSHFDFIKLSRYYFSLIEAVVISIYMVMGNEVTCHGHYVFFYFLAFIKFNLAHHTISNIGLGSLISMVTSNYSFVMAFYRLFTFLFHFSGYVAQITAKVIILSVNIFHFTFRHAAF